MEKSKLVKDNIKLTKALLYLVEELSIQNCPVCSSFVAEGHDDKDCPLKDILK